MNSIIMRIPNFVDGIRPPPFIFETNEDLFDLDFVKRYSESDKFDYFAMYDDCLMAIFKENSSTKYWAVGIVEKPEEINLPEYEKI